MKTKRLYYEGKYREQAITEACSFLKAGEVVAFPTETVYGLGADATSESAVSKIFEAKGRPSDNPLIVHVANRKQLGGIVSDYPEYVEKLIDVFSPGPITYVLPSNYTVAANVSAGLDTVGVRIPNHPAAKALLEKCQLPIAAPSANKSGKPSPTKAVHVLDDLDGKIHAVLDGGSATVGLESTVVDCTGQYPVILRLGQITQEEIRQVVGNAERIVPVTMETPKSPGMKYKHYVPEVPLVLVQDQNNLQPSIDAERGKNLRVGALVTPPLAHSIQADKLYFLGKDETEIAQHLYEVLRSLKKQEVDIVFVAAVSTQAVGQAVLDRLKKAAIKII